MSLRQKTPRTPQTIRINTSNGRTPKTPYKTPKKRVLPLDTVAVDNPHQLMFGSKDEIRDQVDEIRQAVTKTFQKKRKRGPRTNKLL